MGDKLFLTADHCRSEGLETTFVFLWSRFSSGDSSGSALTSELTPGNSDEDYLIRCTRRDSSCPVETLTHGGKVKSVCEENPSWWAGCVLYLIGQ
ncbi:hypothetical protein RRG08_057160 [Elysia crispata]|uniref:Uncharacterized protein n=1 Tax=Elysia crispata TaxID=231223 RepID=A0AAE0XVG7_9GAST|nr:hypothetical protein RRG08_057160 [Elysia crispata]